MRIIQVDCGAGPTTLKLGLQGENEVTAVEFDLAAFVTEFGAGQPVLYVRRCADESPYLSELSVDGTKATWTVTGTDTANSGHGKAQLAYYVGEQVKKTVVCTTYVAPSVEQGDVPPDPYESYLERMAEIGAQVAQSAEEVRTAVSQAESDITEAISQAESDITTAVTQAESSITSTAQTATQSITTTATQALTTINAAVTQAQAILTEMQELLNNHNGITYKE